MQGASSGCRQSRQSFLILNAQSRFCVVLVTSQLNKLKQKDKNPIFAEVLFENRVCLHSEEAPYTRASFLFYLDRHHRRFAGDGFYMFMLFHLLYKISIGDD